MAVGVIFWLGLFVVSLFILIRASQYFIKSAEKLGLAMRIPPFIVGVTIVAIGTSLPELASSIFAVTKGTSEIVVGNVVGSNIANIFLVLGVAAIFSGNIKLLRSLIRVDLPLLIGATFLLAVTIWDGQYTIFEALLSLFLLAIYLRYTVSVQQEARLEEEKEIERRIRKDIRKKMLRKMVSKRKVKFSFKSLLILIASLIFIYLGANFTIESVIELSKFFDVGAEIIALSAVALGTSLPELVVSISAIRNRKGELAVGNVLGSTIFNSLGVMGIPALFGTLVIPQDILTFSLPLMLIAALLYFFIEQDKEITKWEGWLLVVFYAFFLGKIFGLV